MASRGLNTMSLMTMIMLVLATICFTVLFINSSNSLTKTIEGTPDDSRRKEPIDKVAKELNALRSTAEQAELDIALRQREIERLEVELSKFGVYYVGDVQIAGTDGRDLTFGGVAYQAKLDQWTRLREYATEVNNRLEYTRKQLEERGREVFAPLEDQIDARSREQQQVLAVANDMDAQYRQDEEKLLSMTDELEDKKAAAEKGQRIGYSERSSDINKKEDSIRSLLEIELRWLTELQPDGKIMETIINDGTVIIDLGSRDKIFAGLLFDVFAHEQGRYVAKGSVEVVDVQGSVATCRVLNEIDGHRRPIAIGDYVGNPVYSAKKPPVFVLSGEFKNYNTDDLASFIRATGGIVSETLRPGCDYLVAGERSEKTQDVAREYQLVAMTEEQLLKYVQPTFSVK